MDDIHTLKKPASRIPILSPFLHFVSMTVVVHLRRSFGFDYLGEKRWFLLFSWAFLMFFFMAWNTHMLWAISPPLWTFGALTVAAYCFHLVAAFLRESTGKRERSKFSGKSHFLPLCKAIETAEYPAERLCHVYLEPALVAAFAILCRLILGDILLSGWLLIAAAGLFTAEFFNHWFTEVRGPAHGDEMEDKMKDDSERREKKGQSETLKPTRQEESVPRRNARPVDEELEEDRHARALGMERPYRLDNVEARFKALIKTDHGDKNANCPEADARTRELIEARNFFRRSLGGG
jgi:hypothetical protein